MFAMCVYDSSKINDPANPNISITCIFVSFFSFRGAVIALVLSECLPPILVIFYIRVRNIHKLTWGGWSFESLNEWGQFLKLALPGMIMLCLEWWSAEVTTFIAGTISEEELAANSVWFQTMVIFYMVRILWLNYYIDTIGLDLSRYHC